MFLFLYSIIFSYFLYCIFILYIIILYDCTHHKKKIALTLISNLRRGMRFLVNLQGGRRMKKVGNQ